MHRPSYKSMWIEERLENARLRKRVGYVSAVPWQVVVFFNKIKEAKKWLLSLKR